MTNNILENEGLQECLTYFRYCYNCKHYFEDTGFNSCDCLKSDDLTEEQYEKHFIDDKPGCPYHEYK